MKCAIRLKLAKGYLSLTKHLNESNQESNDNMHSITVAPSVRPISKRRVWDEVAFGLKNLGYSANRIKSLVEGSLSLLDLLPLQDCNPYDLGYSERKRVALASIIAMDTPIIVLDEPTGGMDPREVNLLKEALDNLRKDAKTVIIISHDMDFVADMIPRVIVWKMGRKKSLMERFETHFAINPYLLHAACCNRRLSA